MNPSEWLTLLFGDVDAGWITISHKRDATTKSTAANPFETDWYHVGNIAGAAKRCEEVRNTSEVYFGCGLRRKMLGPPMRGCSTDVAVLPGLWTEIDCKASSRKNYFPSKEEAVKFANEELPLKPSIIIDSGNGIHLYWLFNEPWILDADDIDHAIALLHGWHNYITSRTQYDIDSVYDLARVLRVPGTFNRKQEDNVLDVFVVPSGADGPIARYDPSSFDEWAAAPKASNLTLPTDIVMAKDAVPPFAKFEALCSADPRFKETWEEKRTDFKDGSSSAYCMSLANTAVQAGWSDQEIVNLLISFKNKCVMPTTPKREGWYKLTVAKARAEYINAPETQDETCGRLETTLEPDEKIACLSRLLGFRILRIIRKQAIDPSGLTAAPWYIMETELGNVEIPDAATFMTRAKFMTLAAANLNKYVNISSKVWPKFAQAFLDASTTEEAPPEDSPYNIYREAVKEYSENRHTTNDPVSAYDESKILIQKDSDVRYFSLTRFSEWARVQKGLSVGQRNISKCLQIINCKRLVLDNQYRGESRTKLTFWSVP